MSDNHALIIRKEDEKSWEDFKPENMVGKKIGVRRANSGDTHFRAFLKNKGVDMSKVEFVELDNHPTSIEGVVKGELDAAIVVGVYRKTAQDRGLLLYKHIDELYGSFVCCRIIVEPKDLAANREQFVTLLKNDIKAYKVFKTDPDRTIKHAIKFYDIEESVLRRELYETPSLGLSPDPESDWIKDFYAELIDFGYCKGPVERLNPFIDTSVYKDALDRVLAENPGDPFYLEVKKHFEEKNSRRNEK
jgi:NitT/TauT family transport system substrate-binding protein